MVTLFGSVFVATGYSDTKRKTAAGQSVKAFHVRIGRNESRRCVEVEVWASIIGSQKLL